MHNTIERPRETRSRWQRWVASPVSQITAVAAIIVGFCVWGVVVDGQSIERAVVSGLVVAAIFVILEVGWRWVASHRR